MGKGSWKRPKSITSAEENLRWDLFRGEITSNAFNKKYKLLKRKGLIKRDGRVLK